MNIQTTNGRQVTITSACITVSRNDLIDGGLFYSLDIVGVLPGCRKAVALSVSPMTRYIWVKPLFGHNGSANIDPAAWAAFIRALPVVSTTLCPERWAVEVTEEIRERAIAHELSICTCPAVNV